MTANQWSNTTQMIDIFDRNVNELPNEFDLLNVEMDSSSKTFTIATTIEANECDFLQFLANVSNPFWNDHGDLRASNTYLNYYGSVLSYREMDIWSQHWVSKLCALGYLLTKKKERNAPWAVIALDEFPGLGLSSKSIISDMLADIADTSVVSFPQNISLGVVKYPWMGITPSTRFCILDDMNLEHEFNSLYGIITGNMFICKPEEKPYSLPFEMSPKFYIPTSKFKVDHCASTQDRQWIISFSNYYDANHKLIYDFDRIFFIEWDIKQWSLFWRLMLDCVRCYRKFGRVQATGY